MKARGRVLSVSGKGGTGKTLIAALLIREILALREDVCILAVDADADANLADALGVSFFKTVETSERRFLRGSIVNSLTCGHALRLKSHLFLWKSVALTCL